VVRCGVDASGSEQGTVGALVDTVMNIWVPKLRGIS
jgi:hypothetical protein